MKVSVPKPISPVIVALTPMNSLSRKPSVPGSATQPLLTKLPGPPQNGGAKMPDASWRMAARARGSEMLTRSSSAGTV